MEGHCRCSRCLVVYYVRVDRLLSAAVASEININRQSQVVHPTLFIPEGWKNLGTTALSLRRNY